MTNLASLIRCFWPGILQLPKSVSAMQINSFNVFFPDPIPMLRYNGKPNLGLRGFETARESLLKQRGCTSWRSISLRRRDTPSTMTSCD